MVAPRQQGRQRRAFLSPHMLINRQLSHKRPKKRQRKILLTQPCSSENLAPYSRENPVSEMNHVVQVIKEMKENIVQLKNDEDRNNETSVNILPGIPLAPSTKNSKRGVIFVLEKASLVLAYVGRTYEILNPDKHADFLRKKNMNSYYYRPDIVHEVLVDILGSWLNMASMVQAVYVKTDQGLLIRVELHVQIPPTLGKFCSLMSQLLQKFSIKARGKGENLMRPLDKHLPVNSRKIAHL
ncbi:hypothetical protein ACH5RR_023088 [Cinchona calisaya]|uniref:Uncharacterized protein n=1 Tax=Cinchona calisaya TaxID=153742 RepID=A0ABD2Z9M8_9GENT